ncbi:beta carbonic anhydrase 5, chloroplastic isoform X2 [Tanacetum coccineum]|uniref:Carbonic anhydrase n=1 Tax=Tanacetum coccineum TaxID=301880 RepID=A0ABQ4Z700_9ASTR
MALKLKAVTEGVGLVQEATENTPMLIKKSADGTDSFTEMKNRFLSFKKEKYLENLDCYKELAEAQSPKNRPCEINDALEFSVNALQVENILVTGHSCCGGIRALMSMEDEDNSSSFIKNWVVVGKAARSSTKATTSNLSFDQQCKHCEKESINNSLLNLLTYPWVEERVAKGLLSLHGGYYNFVDCTYKKWNLDY